MRKKSHTVYGYARAATQKQKIKSQEEKILQVYSDALIFSDEYSGILADQPQWDSLREKLLPGDSLILCDITKLSDDPERCAQIYADLFRQGIRIELLDDPLLSSEIYSGASAGGSSVDCLMMAAAAQIRITHELTLQKAKRTGDRIRDSLIQAQADGNHIGRPYGARADQKKAVIAKQKIWELSADFQGTLSDPELLELVGVARNTFYKYKKQLSLYGPAYDNRRDKK